MIMSVNLTINVGNEFVQVVSAYCSHGFGARSAIIVLIKR